MQSRVATNEYKWLYFLLAIFFIVIASGVIGYNVYEKKYQNKIYPGLYLGQIDLGGLSREAAKTKVQSIVDNINQEGLIFHYHNQKTALFPLVASLEGDVAVEIINFDVDSTINIIYAYGRVGNFLNRLNQKISSQRRNKTYAIFYLLNEDEVNNFLDNNFSHFTTPAKDATLVTSYNPPYYQLEFLVEDEQYGQTLDYEKVLKELHQHLRVLDFSPTELQAMIDYPQIYTRDTAGMENRAEDIVANAPLKLTHEYQQWFINKPTLADWLALKQLNNPTPGDIIVGLNYDLVDDWLTENIASKVNQEPVEAKFAISSGKVTEFQASRDGQELDMINTIARLEKNLLSGTSTTELIVVEQKSLVQTEDINELGIKELIGIGHSDFSGSPQNRRHNIGVGAASVNGTLLAPDEEFSLLKVIGEVSADTGYLPELVIKEGKTTPEYGGGLCQIGTTMFRVTIDSGLPVTMRRNHSFRVSYYEPSGTDATIYDPWPDYKFLNDTGNHILIQSRIEGSQLYFDFWGTRDGRIATTTYPVVYNIVRPAPTKIIETLDLEPGVKKCTEHAVNGADAYFDYTVYYPNGEVSEERFKSHYVPWREVCLLGVETLSQSDSDSTSTSTKDFET